MVLSKVSPLQIKVKIHKHLGLTLSKDAKWTSHLSIIVNKAWQRIGIFRRLRTILSRASLEKMYFSFIRPLLEYGDIVWDNCSQQLKADIEHIQMEAARIVSGATKLCNIERLLTDLNWETLAQRRRQHKLIQFYKMKNHLTVSYLSNLIPPNRIRTYHLRNTTEHPVIQTNTQCYALSFLPSTIRE